MENVQQARVVDPKSLLAVELPLKIIAMVRARAHTHTTLPTTLSSLDYYCTPCL